MCALRYMSESASEILELCIAQPSTLRRRIGSALIDSLPPCRAAFVELLPARLQAQGGVLCIPVPDKTATDSRPAGGICWGRCLQLIGRM